MSWNGTVRCSHCFKTGHNRRSCPELKKMREEALAKPEEERSYSERSIIYEAERRKQTTVTRTCTYCGKEGHNRRSCEVLKVHIGQVQKQEVAFRKAFIQHLNDIGLNLGALITPESKDRGYSNKGAYFVTQIKWQDVTICEAHEMFHRFVLARPIEKLGSHRDDATFNIRSPQHWPTSERWHATADRWQEEYYGLKVLAGVAEDIKPPEGWLEDTTKIREFFKDRESWQWPSDPSSTGDYYKCDWWVIEEDQELKKSA